MFFRQAVLCTWAFACTIFSCATPLTVAAAETTRTVSTANTTSPVITQLIDSTKSIAMDTGLRPEIAAIDGVSIVDGGLVSDALPMEHMLLLLRRPAQQEQALAQFMAEQNAPDSPNYHHWLTSEEIGEYGLAQSDIDTITAFLALEGFSVNGVSADRMTIDFSGTAGQVRNAFLAPIHTLVVNGESHIANVAVPQIPIALSPAIVGIVSLNNFRAHSHRTKATTDYTVSSAYHDIVPADLATIYNLNPLFNASPKIDGTGQTIVLLEEQDLYASADIDRFRSVFGLPAFGVGGPTFSQVHPGGCTDPGNKNDGTDGEVELDIEWAGAAAPGASLVMASCADTSCTYGVMLAMQGLNSANDSARLWSISYGVCEASNGSAQNAAFSTTYQTAAARGVSVFVSTGDEGAASCDANQTNATHGIAVNGWASTPYNVAVGGTDFGDTYDGTTDTYWNTTNTATYGSAKSYINEIPWNDSCASDLIAAYNGFTQTYGSSGFCNSSKAQSKNLSGQYIYLTTASGSGGPSRCAKGNSSNASIVSGSCAGNAKPSWQSGLFGNPADGVRDIPDVSLFAANGAWHHYFVYCYSNTAAGHGGQACTGAPSSWSGAGGTSFSTPIMAGIQALVNQRTGSAQGNPNSTYYALAAAEYGTNGNTACDSSLGNGVASSCIFHDVTLGSTNVNCTGSVNCLMPSGSIGVLSTSSSDYEPSFDAGDGWDFATGIGTVNAANLANNWPGVITPGKLVVTSQPPSSGISGAAISVSVSVETNSGSVVTSDTSSVTIALTSPGNATLSGTTTVRAVNGVASFTNLSIDKVGTYTLTATESGLTNGVSHSIAIAASSAKTVTFTTQPSSGSAIASGTTIPLVAHVADAGGNAIASQNVSLTLAANPNGATLTASSTSVSTNANGDAVFSSVSLDKTGSGYQLAASDTTTPSAATATSNAFNIVAGSAAKLVFVQQPANGSVGTAIPAITIKTQDANGNDVAQSVVAITLSANGPGAITNGATASTSAGSATFDAVTINAAGNYTVTAASGNLTGATSNAFSIGKANQSITFSSVTPTAATVSGAAYNVAATASSNAAVAFSIDANSATVCSISGASVSFIGVGMCVVDANQSGNANYNAAAQAQQSFAVNKGAQTIAITTAAPTNAAVGGSTYTIAATATSGAAVAFTIDPSSNDVCSISGATVSFVGSGTCTIDANQSGNANYNAAPTAQQSFGVGVGAAAKLVFSAQPANMLAGNATSAAVSIEDSAGNLVSNDNSTQISISVAACGTTTLQTATAVGGVARFPSLRLDSVATDQQLHAISNTALPSVDSATFNVAANSDIVLIESFECTP